jgi:hypothetical protein
MKSSYALFGKLTVVGMALVLSGCSGQSNVDFKGISSEKASNAGGKKTALSVPTLTCGASTQTSIKVKVTAGSTGAPAGFSLQWMTAADFAANGGWFLSGDGRLCKAGFSGVPKSSINRFSLASGAHTEVEVGNLFDEELGVSFSCEDVLQCGTTYKFRAFAHNDPVSGLGKSDLTQTLSCSTLACGSEDMCTYTQGYWKNHGPMPSGNNAYVWPAIAQSGGLTLGSVNYTAQELQDIFNTPAAGNGLISLVHQLAAVKLNGLNGADTSAVSAQIAAADSLIGALVVPPVGTGSLAPSATGALTSALADYNQGATGPGHCEN